LVALATFLVFSRALTCGFVAFDDDRNFLGNLAYRGLGLAQLRWMWTTTLTGIYQPLSWMTYGLDYSLWGMRPFGYHLTNALLHSANAALFYLVCVRLLQDAAPAEAASARRIRVASAVAALLFSIHPLRVESVAWITERRDVLSGFFYLATILAYLRACAEERLGAVAARSRALPIALFTASLLAKGSGIGLPVTLLVLDAYPLRRRALAEKIPYFVLAAAAAWAGAAAQARASDMVPLSALGVGARAAQIFDTLGFYLQKTALPMGLIPAYERPLSMNLLTPTYLTRAGLAAGLVAAAVFLRRRRPAITASAVHYAAALVPVLGLVQFGANVIADRYSYLSCLCWPVLAAGFVSCGWEAFSSRTRALLGAGTIAVLAALGTATWSQIGVWTDTTSLWTRVLAVEPGHAQANDAIGTMLFNEGRVDESIPFFLRSLATVPMNPGVHNNLGAALAAKGRGAEAAAEFRESLRLRPSSDAESNLADELAREGLRDEAAAHYKAALTLNPALVHDLDASGLALLNQDRFEEGIAFYRRALSLDPGDYSARINVGAALMRLKRPAEALPYFQAALRGSPRSSEAADDVGLALGTMGRDKEAVPYFQEALRLDPESAQIRANLTRAQANAR
jgi:tetratricopeptide (TPR) repeat protein